MFSRKDFDKKIVKKNRKKKLKKKCSKNESLLKKKCTFFTPYNFVQKNDIKKTHFFFFEKLESKIFIFCKFFVLFFFKNAYNSVQNFHFFFLIFFFKLKKKTVHKVFPNNNLFFNVQSIVFFKNCFCFFYFLIFFFKK